MTVDDCHCNTVAQCSVADERKQSDIPITPSLSQTTWSRQEEAQTLSWRKRQNHSQLFHSNWERRGKLRLRKQMKGKRSWKLLELGRLTQPWGIEKQLLSQKADCLKDRQKTPRMQFSKSQGGAFLSYNCPSPPTPLINLSPSMSL